MSEVNGPHPAFLLPMIITLLVILVGCPRRVLSLFFSSSSLLVGIRHRLSLTSVVVAFGRLSWSSSSVVIIFCRRGSSLLSTLSTSAVISQNKTLAGAAKLQMHPFYELAPTKSQRYIRCRNRQSDWPEASSCCFL